MIEYVYIKCTKCNERVKLVQDKGSHNFVTYDYGWITDFFVHHIDCEPKPILEYD